jgi:hypothetical protein
MSSQGDNSREEREADIERKLCAVLGEVEERIGFRSNIELTVSLYSDERIGVFLRDPDAKKLAKAWGDSLWEDEIDRNDFHSAAGDPVQQAVAWVRSACEGEVLRQKRQAELQEAIDYYLICGEELPPSRSVLREELQQAATTIPLDEGDGDEPPPTKKKPRQGPPPPDMSLRNSFWASVSFSQPDELWVRLTDRFNKEVAKPRRFKLPESGSLAEVFAWIREMDEQHERTGGVN